MERGLTHAYANSVALLPSKLCFRIWGIRFVGPCHGTTNLASATGWLFDSWVFWLVYSCCPHRFGSSGASSSSSPSPPHIFFNCDIFRFLHPSGSWSLFFVAGFLPRWFTCMYNPVLSFFGEESINGFTEFGWFWLSIVVRYKPELIFNNFRIWKCGKNLIQISLCAIVLKNFKCFLRAARNPDFFLFTVCSVWKNMQH